MTQRTVRPPRVVIHLLSFDQFLCVFKWRELIDVQAFIAKPSIEAFYGSVFSRLSWMREIEFNARPHAQVSSALDVNSVP